MIATMLIAHNASLLSFYNIFMEAIMGKNEIQDERMRQYFINSAKEIITSEGISAVSVRNVAKKAGYSYATLYNYFKNVWDLIFVCVEDFIKECKAFVLADIEKVYPGRERIVAITHSYSKFFVQYPGLFDLLFLEEANGISPKTSLEPVYTLFDELVGSEFNLCVSEKLIKKSSAKQVQSGIKLAVHGALMFYMTRRHTQSYQEFSKEIDSIIDFWIKK